MSSASRHALIIEDDLVTALGVQQILSELGFESFAFAAPADQALEQGRLRRPHLITADLGLLDGDGMTAAGALLRALGPIPIVYVTGQAHLLAPATGIIVVAKPFGREDMLRACRDAVGQSLPA